MTFQVHDSPHTFNAWYRSVQYSLPSFIIYPWLGHLAIKDKLVGPTVSVIEGFHCKRHYSHCCISDPRRCRLCYITHYCILQSYLAGERLHETNKRLFITKACIPPPHTQYLRDCSKLLQCHVWLPWTMLATSNC